MSSIDIFRHHVEKCKAATNKPFGVNLPLTHGVEGYIDYIIEQKIPVVFTSAGSPKLFTKKLKDQGITVVHVVPNTKLALKCQAAGVDAVVAEGFEAGGHNGMEEITTMTLIPQVRRHLDTAIPLIAAGGIAGGDAMAAAMALGAEGVQVGTRFAITKESSASDAFKQRCLESKEGETVLTLKNFMPTRLILNEYGKEVTQLANSGASKEKLMEFRGRGRTKRGIFDGDIVNGELEIGQIVSDIEDVPSVEEVVQRMVKEYNARVEKMSTMKM